ncbi:MAG: hypothetical protein RJA09_2356 [Pseudomonadota bacterium]|jgi:ABC-type uncharacterized transport system permease subunit
MILAASTWFAAPSLAAALGYALLSVLPQRLGRAATSASLVAVWVLHSLALGLASTQTPPRFGFGPALSVTAWLVFTIYAVESRLYPQLKARWTLSALGTLAVLLALWFPGATYDNITSNWMPLHWALGIASYGMLAAAVVHAWLMQRAETAMRQAKPGDAPLPLLALERLTFRFVGAGFVLLSATLLAGWWFAGSLGHGAWTHKSVFTALSWATLGLLLWGRWRWGWRGRRAIRTVYSAAVLLLLGYVGSRFVLEVVLQRV